MRKKQDVVITNWDKAYDGGKYNKEGPLALVADIISAVRENGLEHSKGFYPGCGNGRNLVPLLDEGFAIEANDISPVAVDQLKKRRPGAKVAVGEFLSVKKQFDYLLSIQLFQHVDDRGPRPLFAQVEELLVPGGLFILRVNSIHTQIVEEYETVKKTPEGGFTIEYRSGQKKGQYIHFYSAEEIHKLTSKMFTVVMPLREEFIAREDGTNWAQWETILRRR